MVSVVVPTYQEADNIPNLVQQLQRALKDISYEVLIVDDNSPDNTVEVCDDLAKQLPVKLIQPKGRPRDLSLSVIDGIVAANSDQIVVMDADLSHPPSMITVMLNHLNQSPNSLIIGSRHVADSSIDEAWSFWRHLNSYMATSMARPLVKCSDPMSGFFMFNRNQINPANLKPIGYKIGLEVMVKGNFDSIIEVPIDFKDRQFGKSKMNLDQQIKYLRHLWRLYLYRLMS